MTAHLNQQWILWTNKKASKINKTIPLQPIKPITKQAYVSLLSINKLFTITHTHTTQGENYNSHILTQKIQFA